jgi:protein HIRA/HIR1
LEKCIDEPFKQCTGTTHVLRLNWSPDGQLIISAHAINNGAPTAQVIDRGNKWNTKLDFVGHRKAVTAVRFFPQILKPNDAQQKDFKTHCLCALGSRDRSISIWLTNYSRALCAFHDLFDNPIMDLSWSRHPNPGLLACSMDGTVAYLEFNYKEIGKPLTKEETNEFFMKKYNYDINASIPLKDQQLNTQKLQYNQANKKDNDNKIKLIENLDVLLAQEQKLKQEQEKKQTNLTSSNDNSMNNLNSSSSNTPKSSADVNIVLIFNLFLIKFMEFIENIL